VEASVRSLKHPFGHSKLPVRGGFRMACMLLAAASMVNVRRICKYQQAKLDNEKSGLPALENSPHAAQADIFLSFFQKRLSAFWRSWSVPESCFSF
jgi:hypothetical protein